MNHCLLIMQIAGGVYILIIGAAILGLLIASIRTWLQIALNAVRRCAREIKTTRRSK